MYCPHCGKDVRDQKEGYCPYCGQRVDSLGKEEFIPATDNRYTSEEEDKREQRKKKDKDETYSLVSLILGILSIFFAFGGTIIIFGGPVAGIIFGIIAIVLAKDRKANAGFAKAGKICGIIGIVLSILIMIVTIVIMILMFIEVGFEGIVPPSFY